MSGRSIKEFGIFLMLKNEGRVRDTPVEIRDSIINRLNELISLITKMIEENGVLYKPHLQRELDLYKLELKEAKAVWGRRD